MLSTSVFFYFTSHTFEAAPFFILVEHAVLAHMRSFIGWKEGDGIFSPGGSILKFTRCTVVSNIQYGFLARKAAAYRICTEWFWPGTLNSPKSKRKVLPISVSW